MHISLFRCVCLGFLPDDVKEYDDCSEPVESKTNCFYFILILLRLAKRNIFQLSQIIILVFFVSMPTFKK